MKFKYDGKTFDNMEDFLADLNKPPKNILEKISIFFGRIKNKILNIKTSIIHAYQRLFRGWDDSAIWSIDYYLAEMMPIWLEELKKKSKGAPTLYLPQDKLMEDMTDDDTDAAQKRWFEDIDIIIRGFIAYKKMEDIDFEWKDIDDLHVKQDKMHIEFVAGMKKLTDVFGTLWW